MELTAPPINAISHDFPFIKRCSLHSERGVHLDFSSFGNVLVLAYAFLRLAYFVDIVRF